MKTVLLAIALLSLGASAQAGYFDQFTFHTEGNCRQIRSIQFHQASSWYQINLGLDSKGRPMHANITLQLFRDHTYWMEYSEIAVTQVMPGNGTRGDLLFRTVLQGRWQAVNGELMVGQWFTGMPSQIEERGRNIQGISARFHAPIHDTRLTDTLVVFSATHGNTGPRGISAAQYCH
jgi:hypothetical protein